MTNSISHIAIIGAGQLGSRHLQGLSRIKQEINISVIDPVPFSLEIARNRFNENPVNPLIQSVNYFESIHDLYEAIDVAIIATKADVRRKVIEKLLTKIKVKYLILEKIVFQDPRDFLPIKNILSKKKVQTWVNCARRSFSFYQELKKSLKNKIIIIKVSGNNWGMACNSIHMIDLLAFLSGETEMSFNTEDLDRQIYPSKRNGFIEISGTMSLSTKRGDILELTDSGASKKYEMEITIDTGQEFYRINEVSRKVLLSRDSGVLEKEIEIPLQSECTGNIIDKMLNTGKSSLTTYEGCMIYHVSMLKAFNDHLCTVTGEKIVACPIT